MESYSWIAWADIHHALVAAKCVTLEDTEKVERAIFTKARKENFDFTLFPGDRYLKREPHDRTKVVADRIMYDLVHQEGRPHFHLVGNHDWTDNTRKWHTAESLKLFNNVTVMDEAKTYRYKNVLIHALPADFELDLSKYDIDSKCYNIFVFHDTVRGSLMNEEGSMRFDNGLELASFDIPQFDLVIAGDIHVRQKFDLKNTWGGYLGSVIQRTRADANRQRGWTEFFIQRETPNHPWKLSNKKVFTPNLFNRMSFQVDESTKFEDFKLIEEDFVDQLVEIKLVGPKGLVDKIADNSKWKDLEKKFKPRRLEVIRAYEVEQSEVTIDLTESNGLLDDISLYLDSKFASLGNLKEEDIIDTVRNLKRREM